MLTLFVGKKIQVYVQLENLSRADPPYKSVAALNCVVLGCANTWDLDRAYETFEAITEKIGLAPDIHSYNALMCAFGKLKKVSMPFSCFSCHILLVKRKGSSLCSQFFHLLNCFL